MCSGLGPYGMSKEAAKSALSSLNGKSSDTPCCVVLGKYTLPGFGFGCTTIQIEVAGDATFQGRRRPVEGLCSQVPLGQREKEYQTTIGKLADRLSVFLAAAPKLSPVAH